MKAEYLMILALFVLLLAVVGLVLYLRVQRWNHRREQWHESERDTLHVFEASKNGRLGRRAADVPDIKVPR